MSVRFIWTEEMVAYIVVKRTAFQWSWKRVSEGFNRKFGTKKSEQSMSSYYRNNILAGNNTFSQEEIDFLHGCFLNNFPFKKTETAFKEYFSKPLKRKSYEWVIKNCESTHVNLQVAKAITKEVEETKNKLVKHMKTKTNRKGIHNQKWTEEEHAGLFTITSGKEQIAYAEKIGKSSGAVKQRMYNHKINMTKNKKATNKTKVQESPKPRKKTTTSKKKYTPRWTDEEDYDLICNFYDLSIDEATIRFNRSYGAIASRLEKIVDSTQPKHKAMLMKAAVEIKSRKRAMSKPVKLSRRERRMARKQARLAKRIAKLKGKMQG